jgi:hypothetical protein
MLSRGRRSAASETAVRHARSQNGSGVIRSRNLIEASWRSGGNAIIPQSWLIQGRKEGMLRR